MEKRNPLPFILFGLVAIAGIFTSLVTDFDGSKVYDTGDAAWMIVATALVLLMTPGLSFFYGGMVGKKNVISTMFQSFIATGLISVLWVVVGFGLAFGPPIGGFIGNPTSFFMMKGINGHEPVAVSSDHSHFAVCIVSNEICYHHTCFSGRCNCRTHTIFCVYTIHDFVQHFNILPACPLDMASGWHFI